MKSTPLMIVVLSRSLHNYYFVCRVVHKELTSTDERAGIFIREFSAMLI
jgi:hypothetical protein